MKIAFSILVDFMIFMCFSAGAILLAKAAILLIDHPAVPTTAFYMAGMFSGMFLICIMKDE